MVVNLNQHPTTLNVVVPRVGGVLDLGDGKGEAFTGGSNLVGAHLLPMHIRQRRSNKMSAQTDFLSVLEKGTELKLGSKRESAGKGSCSLVQWFQALSDAMEGLGLDTIFCIPDATWTDEINILKSWGRISNSLITDWLTELKTGVVDKRTNKKVLACPYDAQNLHFSGMFLLASCTPTHRQLLLDELGSQPNGLQVLLHIVSNRQCIKTSKQRDLVLALQKLNISSTPGEDVPTLNSKIRQLCKEIEQVGTVPDDLALVCA